MEEKPVNVRELLKRQPQFTQNTPLDKLFSEIVSQVFDRISKSVVDCVEWNYKTIGFKNNDDFVSFLLGYISKLHSLTIQQQLMLKKQGKNFLPISLHDIRYVDELISLIVVHGFSSNMPKSCRIPIQKSKNDGEQMDKKIYDIPNDHDANLETLNEVAQFFYDIITGPTNVDDYIKVIFLKGTIYTNTFLAMLTLETLNSEKGMQKQLHILESAQETYELYVGYTYLQQIIKDVSAQKLLMDKLVTLPLRRENGVISLIDFILGVRENEELSLEKLDRVNQILLSKPKSLSNKDYLSKLFDQIYQGLSFINRPVLVTCLNNLIAEFYRRNKKIVKDFLLQRIFRIFYNSELKSHSAKSLNDTINVIISLSKNSSIEFINYLVSEYDKSKFYLHLWTYALYLFQYQEESKIEDKSVTKKEFQNYYEVVLTLMQSLIIVNHDFDMLNTISLHLTSFQHDSWKFATDNETQLAFISLDDENDTIIKEKLFQNTSGNDGQNITQMSEFFIKIDTSVTLFIKLLNSVNDEDTNCSVFLNTLNRWAKSSCSKNVNHKLGESKQDDALLTLVDLKLLSQLQNHFQADITKKAQNAFSVIDEVLDLLDEFEQNSSKQTEDSDDEEIDGESDEENTEDTRNNVLEILLKLLSSLMETTNEKTLLENERTLNSIKRKLATQTEFNSDVDLFYKNFCIKLAALKHIPKAELTSHSNINNDREVLNKALLEINDLVAPIKVHGLIELQKLLKNKSSVMTTEKAIRLHLQQLRNTDPYVYLNVIKSLSSLCQLDPKMVIPALIEFYDNDRKINKLDDVLKVGEVFVNYIQTENELFGGDLANSIMESCIRKIQKQQKLDNKVRMSAMSILGLALQVNANGVSRNINDMLDCAFNILQLEKPKNLETKNDDSFMMRRAALQLIYDLASATGLTHLQNQFTPQKTHIIVSYLISNDEDLIVQEKAKQLLELLDSI